MKKLTLISMLLLFALAAFATPAPISREQARAQVVAQIEKAWAASSTKEPLRLIVIVVGDSQEGRRVFPKGVKHLPDTLTPRVIYCCQPECTRAVQYLGLVRRDGFTFAAFRFLTD